MLRPTLARQRGKCNTVSLEERGSTASGFRRHTLERVGSGWQGVLRPGASERRQRADPGRSRGRGLTAGFDLLQTFAPDFRRANFSYRRALLKARDLSITVHDGWNAAIFRIASA
jgi:hypothetical protein